MMHMLAFHVEHELHLWALSLEKVMKKKRRISKWVISAVCVCNSYKRIYFAMCVILTHFIQLTCVLCVSIHFTGHLDLQLPRSCVLCFIRIEDKYSWRWYICELGIAHMCSTPSVRSIPSVAILIGDDPSHPSEVGQDGQEEQIRSNICAGPFLMCYICLPLIQYDVLTGCVHWKVMFKFSKLNPVLVGL